MLFQERQRFNQWWIWLLLIGITLIPVYGIYRQILKGHAFGDQPMSDWGLIVFLLFMLLFDLFFYLMQLRTQIDSTAIHFRFFPFLRRAFRWSDIAAAQVIDYGFVGGWGIRLATRYGTVYNVRGSKGLLLKFKNGKQICIGTQKEEALKKVIAEIRREHNLEQIIV